MLQPLHRADEYDEVTRVLRKCAGCRVGRSLARLPIIIFLFFVGGLASSVLDSRDERLLARFQRVLFVLALPTVLLLLR